MMGLVGSTRSSVRDDRVCLTVLNVLKALLRAEAEGLWEAEYRRVSSLGLG